MSSSPKFWNKIAEKYARDPVKNQEAYEQKLQETQALLTPSSRLFEFGCGTGTTAISHAPHVKHIDAIDISENMIAIAERKASKAGVKNISFSVQPIEDFVAKGKSYNIVLAMSILHLLDNRKKTTEQVFALLKPGGYFVSSTACIADFMNWFRFIAPLGNKLGVIPYVEVFSREQLRDEIRESGFDIHTDWSPEKSAALFLIARKPGRKQSSSNKWEQKHSA